MAPFHWHLQDIITFVPLGIICCSSPCRRSVHPLWGSSLDLGQRVPVRKNSIVPQATPPHPAVIPHGRAAAAPGGVLVRAKWCKGCRPVTGGRQLNRGHPGATTTLFRFWCACSIIVGQNKFKIRIKSNYLLRLISNSQQHTFSRNLQQQNMWIKRGNLQCTFSWELTIMGTLGSVNLSCSGPTERSRRK